MTKKKVHFPSQKEIEEVLKELDKGLASRPLRPNATTLDRLKFDLCEQFVIYRLRTKIPQKTLAERLGIDPAPMSKILHYHYDEFTVDRLLRYLEVLHAKVTVSVKVA